MPIVNLRDWDTSGELTPTPSRRTGMDDVFDLAAGAKKAYSKFRTDRANAAFREAAAKEMNSGNSQNTYEFDPATGQFKVKIEPKKIDANDVMRRWLLRQQFGIDPMTGETVPQDQLRKPRFGYTSDIFSQILAGMTPGADPNAEASAAAPNVAAGGGMFSMPNAQAATGAPNITVPSTPGGGQPRFLDPLELEAQNAIQAGADPVAVKARLAQIRGARRGGV